MLLHIIRYTILVLLQPINAITCNKIYYFGVQYLSNAITCNKVNYFSVVTTNHMLLYYFGFVTANPMLLLVIRYSIVI